MELVYFVSGIILGIISAIFVSKLIKSKEEIRLKGLDSLLLEASTNLGIASGKLEALKAEKDNLQGELNQAKDDCKKEFESNIRMNEQQKTDKALLEDTIDIREKFKTEFKSIANEVLLESNKSFSSDSSVRISQVLGPMKETIDKFEKALVAKTGHDIQNSSYLKTELERQRELTKFISKETSNLTEALKGNNKIQGNWGELILDRVLENSGLRKGKEYTVQAIGLDLKNEEGSTQKPDVIIHLPNNRQVIVDSKVSLKSYEKYMSAESDESKLDAHKEFIESIKAHVKNLSDKKYHMLDKLNTPDFVILFIPIEGAFSLYLQSGEEAFKHGLNKQVIIASPTTLLAMLRTVDSSWQQDRQSKNAIVIAKLAGDIYNKFVMMSSDIDALDKSLVKSRESFDSFKRRISGRDSVSSIVEKMKVLGARTNKAIKAEYVEELDEVGQELESLPLIVD